MTISRKVGAAMVVASHRIPVAKGRERDFEHYWLGRFKLADMLPGFVRNEFLKPLEGNTYVVLSYWESPEQLKVWLENDVFQKEVSGKKTRELFSGSPSVEVHEVVGLSERVREMPD